MERRFILYDPKEKLELTAESVDPNDRPSSTCAVDGALSDGKRTNGKTEENACGQMGNSNS